MAEDDSNDITRLHIQLSKDTIIGHYRIVEKIGTGGMGDVYLAEDTELNRKVALKFLPPHLSQDANCRARFRREAQAAAKLNHPNIITIYEVNEFRGRPYFAMEYVDGLPPDEYIRQTGPSLDGIINIAIQISLGLQEAHNNGIIHRDIKPGNILIDKNGRAKILDFGLATIIGVGKITKTGVTIGTLNYMSPEQVRGEELDCRTDIFSLAVMLYEMLTGHLPFQGEYEAAVLYSIVSEEPPSISQYRPDIDTAFVSVITKALQKDRVNRHQTAQELIRDLQNPHVAAPIIRSPTVTRIQGTKSLAVLYLRNLGKSDDEYLCYGLTEDLIIAMTRVRSLQVSPMRSILKWKDSDAEIEEIALTLNVDLVLDGSILKMDETVRVSAQLIDICNKQNLWADRWEEPISDIPQIRRALVQGVYLALGIDSPHQLSVRGIATGLINPQAYEYCLRAKYAFEHKQDKADVETALGLYHRALEIEPALLRARAEIAQIHLFKGEYAMASRELIDALEEARSRMLKSDEAHLLRILAAAYTGLSQWDKAWEVGQDALELDRESADLTGEAETLAILINILQPRARYDEALELFQRVLEISRQLGDPERMSSALKNMGGIYYYKGDYDHACELFMEALAIARKREDHSLEAKCLSNIGIIYINTGNFGEALCNLQQALHIFEQIGSNQVAIANTSNNIAFVYGCQGDYRKALELNERSSAIHKEQSNLQDYLISQCNIAHDLSIIGDYETAILTATNALGEARTLALPVAISTAHNNLGTAYFWKGDKMRALQHLQQAVKVAVESDLRGSQISPHSRLAELYQRHGLIELSRKHCQLCVNLIERQNRGPIWARVSTIETVLNSKEGDLDLMAARLKRLVEQAYRMGCPELIVFTERHLGALLLTTGQNRENHIEGIQILQRALDIAKETEIEHEVRWITETLQGRSIDR
ncbi:MAG: tetratricopeptide repeat protein [Candidatus Zixiibacteriota bacterium]